MQQIVLERRGLWDGWREWVVKPGRQAARRASTSAGCCPPFMLCYTSLRRGKGCRRPNVCPPLTTHEDAVGRPHAPAPHQVQRRIVLQPPALGWGESGSSVGCSNAQQGRSGARWRSLSPPVQTAAAPPSPLQSARPECPRGTCPAPAARPDPAAAHRPCQRSPGTRRRRPGWPPWPARAAAPRAAPPPGPAPSA